MDLAGDATVGVSFPADLAGGVTVGVAPSTVAEVASSAVIAEAASSADLAAYVTVGVASLAYLAEVASLADMAEVASLADHAEVASSADIAEVASSAKLAGYVTIGMNLRPTLLLLSPPVKCDVLSGLVLDSYPDVALLNQMIMSCIMIFMDRMTVGYIAYLGVRLV